MLIQDHFFICPAGAVRSVPVDPEDPDWEKIGFDGGRPKLEEAFRRLVEKRDRYERGRSP